MTPECEDRICQALERIAAALESRQAAPKAPSGPASAAGSDPGSGAAFPNYGRSKGHPVRGATRQDLDYYRAGCERTLADPGKAKFHAKERALLAAIDEELARQGGGAQPSEPPAGYAPESDEIPF